MKSHEGNIPGRFFRCWQLIQMQCSFGTWIRLLHNSNSIWRQYGFMQVRPPTETEKQCSTLLAFIYGPRLHLAVFSGKKQVALPPTLGSIPKLYLLDLPLNHPALQN